MLWLQIYSLFDETNLIEHFGVIFETMPRKILLKLKKTKKEQNGHSIIIVSLTATKINEIESDLKRK